MPNKLCIRITAFVLVLVVAIVVCLVCGLFSLRLAQRSCGNFLKHLKPNKTTILLCFFHVLWFNFHCGIVEANEFDGALNYG